MATRRGKSQARRNTGSSSGLPGWAWMVLGIVLTIGVIFAAPKFMKSDEGDGFFRPRANPDAQPVSSENEDDADLVTGEVAEAPTPAADDKDAEEDGPDYDFYDLLPGEEVALTDAQIAAAAREEQARARATREREQAAEAASRPQPLPEDIATARVTSPTAPTAPASTTSTPPPTVASAGNDTPYILQAGSFSASGDAETVKAKIALLGLNARVESAQISGKTVYRVRMGPYGTASELASAKGKLAGGGLPALAIKAK